MQACFKIIESTCLSRGIDMEIAGGNPSPEFRTFVSRCVQALSYSLHFRKSDHYVNDLKRTLSMGVGPSVQLCHAIVISSECYFGRYYTPFVENAIRYFFTLGFVPWRLRKISSGDVVPEIIPLGIFTWTIESMGSRQNKGGGAMATASSNLNALSARLPRGGADKQQIAAEASFQKLKKYFSDPKRVPYPLQGDVMRMSNRSDETEKAKESRLQGFGEHHRSHNSQLHAEKGSQNLLLTGDGKPGASKRQRAAEDDDPRPSGGSGGAKSSAGVDVRHGSAGNTAAYKRQRAALARCMLFCVQMFLHVVSCPDALHSY